MTPMVRYLVQSHHEDYNRVGIMKMKQEVEQRGIELL